MLLVFNAGAHTLPISYLRLQPDTDYLHLELSFNPFELTFFSELDDNHDGELGLAELKAHGQTVANRVAGALKIVVGDNPIYAETAGMDPDLSGHHVRLRAHYKVNARQLPLTLESELNAVTSSSHLIQVTYAAEGRQQLAQLDAQSHKVTFQPLMATAPPPMVVNTVQVRGATLGALLLLAVLLLIVLVAALLLLLRKRPVIEEKPRNTLDTRNEDHSS